MKRLLAKAGIPNVVAFKLGDAKLNTVALLYEAIVQTRKLEVLSKIRRVSRANYFLSKQFNRLLKYARKGEFKKFDFLAKKLLTSYSFQIQAYNSVFPKWLLLKIPSVCKHLRYIRKLCHDRSTQIEYTRVWIDKKPGDAARPLGVPTVTWRVYLRMVTNIGEIYLEGTNKYSSFQHGGRPGYGVMTCLKEMIRMFEKFKYVYEFDLKGFFDHVSKNSVKEFFKDTFLGELYYQMLFSKPKAYKLPDPKADPALLEYRKVENSIKTFKTKDGRLIEVDMDWGVHDLPLEYFGFQVVSDAEYDRIMMEAADAIDSASSRYTADELSSFVPQSEVDRWDEIEAKVKGPISLAEEYGKLMDPEMRPTFTARIGNAKREVIPSTEEQRNLGRDAWKDLNLKEQGIPQGTSFGPMLASTIVAYHLRDIPNLLMYVDDGMIFMNKENPFLVEKMRNSLKKVQVEIAEKKSRWVSSEQLREGIKFLGVRFFPQVRSYSSMRSETRKGTSKDFRILEPGKIERLVQGLKETVYQDVIEKLPVNPIFKDFSEKNIKHVLWRLREDGLITTSKEKFLRWMITSSSSKLRDLMLHPSLNIAIKYGFFGYLLAESYNPQVSMTDLKNKIKEGITAAHHKMYSSKNSVGRMLMERGFYGYDDSNGIYCEQPVNIYNCPTMASDLLLEIGKDGILKDSGVYPLKKEKSLKHREWLNKRYRLIYAYKQAALREQVSNIRWRKSRSGR